jgi:hypothetical protein
MIKLSKADTLPNREIPQSKTSPSLRQAKNLFVIIVAATVVEIWFVHCLQNGF